jgi:hypothetical protein
LGEPDHCHLSTAIAILRCLRSRVFYFCVGWGASIGDIFDPDRIGGSCQMPQRDVNEEAVRQVNELTDSGPINGEDLLESEDLKRKLREAKERVLKESEDPNT